MLVNMETLQVGAWKWMQENPTVDSLISAAKAHLRIDGWDSIRPALSTTIRAWIMQGFISNRMEQYRNETKNASWRPYYEKAIRFLEEGKKTWPNASPEDRGIVFENTFIRGVLNLQLMANHEVRLIIVFSLAASRLNE